MRWIFFVILAWLLVVVQTTLGRLLTYEGLTIGTIGPDLVAPLAVFLSLCVRRSTDAAIAACLLGFLLDLTTGAANGSFAVVGPMAMGYALAGKMLFHVREAFFRQRLGTQVLLTLGFGLIAHGVWVSLQSLLAYGQTSWGEYGRMLLQAAAISGCSAVLAPLEFYLLNKAEGWLVPLPAGRARRRR